jgi:hypothetical protein
MWMAVYWLTLASNLNKNKLVAGIRINDDAIATKKRKK